MKIFSFSYRFNDSLPDGFVIDARTIENPMITVRVGDWVTDGDLRATVMYEAEAKNLVNKGIGYLSGNPEGVLLIGCDYGRHRSVAVANAIAEHFGVTAEHLSPGSNGKKRR